MVRVLYGSPTKIHLEHRDFAVEEFLEMLRFEQRDKVAGILYEAELSGERLRERSS
jgi:hypothetical protein